MEQIRRRRLAKLGGPSGSSTPATASPSTETPPGTTTPGPSSSKPAESKTPANEANKPTPITDRPKVNKSPAPAAGTPPTGTSTTTNEADSRAKRRASDIDGPSAIAPPRKTNTPASSATSTTESIEDYADRVLSNIFRVSVDNSRTVDSHGHKLTFLPGLSSELAEEDGGSLKLSIGRLEEAIMEAATAVPRDRPVFEYLLGCWKRVIRTLKTLRGSAMLQEKEALLREARRLCFSNCIFALTMPELFG
jgi:ubiquitin conjugation factor E4 B